jgi:transposase-like protein
MAVRAKVRNVQCGHPHVFVTDKLRSYGAALKDLGLPDDRETGRWLNNRAENSHLPFRGRERAMLRFRRMQSLQKFVAVHSSIHNHFNQERGLSSRVTFNSKRHGHAEGMVTDRLRSYGVALNELGIRDRQETGR